MTTPLKCYMKYRLFTSKSHLFPISERFTIRIRVGSIFSVNLQCCRSLQNIFYDNIATQSGITCSKLTVETLEQGVKYIQK